MSLSYTAFRFVALSNWYSDTNVYVTIFLEKVKFTSEKVEVETRKWKKLDKQKLEKIKPTDKNMKNLERRRGMRK